MAPLRKSGGRKSRLQGKNPKRRKALRPGWTGAPSPDSCRDPGAAHGCRRNPGSILSTPRQYFWLFFVIIFIPQTVFFVVNFGLQFLISGDVTQDFSSSMGAGVRRLRVLGRADLSGAAILGPRRAHPRGFRNVLGSQHFNQGLLWRHAEPAWSADRHYDPLVYPGLWSPCFVWDHRSRGCPESRRDGPRGTSHRNHCSGRCHPCHMDFHNPVSELACGRQSRGAGGEWVDEGPAPQQGINEGPHRAGFLEIHQNEGILDYPCGIPDRIGIHLLFQLPE